MYKSNAKVGVYVDVANINRNGGYGMHYDILREFACRDQAEAIRLNAYVSYDETRAREDITYRKGINGYFSVLREYGFKVIQKNVKWYEDEKGRYGKANADLDMAVDALLQSKNLDRVMLITGDGDFVQVVRALQNNGCRVEVVGFDNISSDLKREADMFISGYLIPNLLPIKRTDCNDMWGEEGSIVRGYCSHYYEERGFGFMRYMSRISPGLWITDSRNNESPYRAAFFHSSNLPEEVNTVTLPNRDLIFEFRLEESKTNKDPVASNIRLLGG